LRPSTVTPQFARGEAHRVNVLWFVTEAIADKNSKPELLVSATNVKEGEIAYFYSGEQGLTLDHVIASGNR